jgi:hypothetical protein
LNTQASPSSFPFPTRGGVGTTCFAFIKIRQLFSIDFTSMRRTYYLKRKPRYLQRNEWCSKQKNTHLRKTRPHMTYFTVQSHNKSKIYWSVCQACSAPIKALGTLPSNSLEHTRLCRNRDLRLEEKISFVVKKDRKEKNLFANITYKTILYKH